MQPLSILHSAPRIPAQSLQMLKKTQKELYELRTMQKTVRTRDMDGNRYNRIQQKKDTTEGGYNDENAAGYTTGYNCRRIQLQEDTQLHTRIQPQYW